VTEGSGAGSSGSLSPARSAAAATVAILLGPAGVAPRQLWRAFRIPLGFCVTGAVPLLFSVGGPDGLVAFAPDGPGDAARLLLRTSAASLGATAFVRAFDRAGRLQDGLAGRGYDGTLRVLVPPATVSRPFLAMVAALLSGIVALTLVLERSLP
jgi:hypothetical protein